MTELNNGIQNGAQEVSKLMLKAVFWDMDGTLIDSEPYWHEGELKIAADHGGYWDEDLAWQGSGTPVPDVARRMVEHGCKLSIEEIGKGMIDYVAQKNYPLIFVTSGKLGSINHTLLSLEAVTRRGIRLHTVAYNLFPEEDDDIIRRDTEAYISDLLAKEYPETHFVIVPKL